MYSSIEWDKEPDMDGLRKVEALLEVDRARAISELERLAGRGSMMAMLRLGIIFMKHNRSNSDMDTAMKWFEMASDKGMILGHFFVGALSARSKHYDRAVEFYKKGASVGHPPSLYRLGWLYMNGFGVGRDAETACDFWARAASLGQVYAKRDLARMLINGQRGALGVIEGIGMLGSAVLDLWKISISNPGSELLY
jgi:TPR repeat protein